MVRVIILAAGKGTRMGDSDLPKVLRQLRGKPLLGHVLAAVADSGLDLKPTVVVGHMAEQVRSAFGDACRYVTQRELDGTGGAVRCARQAVEDAAHVMVLVGDQPLMQGATLRRIVDTHLASDATLTMGTVEVPDFESWRAPLRDYGRIERDHDGNVIRIIEVKDATPSHRAIREVSPSYLCFKAAWLYATLETLPLRNTKEYYLTDAIAAAVAASERIVTAAITPAEAIGVNTLEHLAIAEALLSGNGKALTA